MISHAIKCIRCPAWLWWLGVLALWLAFTRPLLGQVYLVEAKTVSCDRFGRCRIQQGYGSAVCVGEYHRGKRILLTAAHVVSGKLRSLKIQVGPRWVEAKALMQSTKADLAIIGVESVELKCMPIAEAVGVGDRVTLHGFPYGREYRSRTAHVVNHRYTDVETVVNLPSISGESGGAVVNDDGELVGIISATGKSHTIVEGPQAIKTLFNGELSWGAPQCGDGVADLPSQPARESGPTRSELLARIAALESRLATLQRKPGPRGLPGPPGPAGASADDRVLQSLSKRLTALERHKLRVQVIGDDGSVIDEESYPINEPIQLRLTPKR